MAASVGGGGGGGARLPEEEDERMNLRSRTAASAVSARWTASGKALSAPSAARARRRAARVSALALARAAACWPAAALTACCASGQASSQEDEGERADVGGRVSPARTLSSQRRAQLLSEAPFPGETRRRGGGMRSASRGEAGASALIRERAGRVGETRGIERAGRVGERSCGGACGEPIFCNFLEAEGLRRQVRWRGREDRSLLFVFL